MTVNPSSLSSEYNENKQRASSSIKSSSENKTVVSSTFDPHSTKWSDISLVKFTSLVAVASTFENGIFYPFYVIKTREQNDRRNFTLWQSFKHHLRSSLSKPITGSLGQNGSLYKGFWFSNLTTIPVFGLYLGVYTYCKEQFNTSNNRLARFYAPFIAGCLADAVCILLYVPGDVIVQRLQIADSPYKSGYDAIRQIYKKEGVKGYYRGLGATFLFTSTYSATWWTVYENTKLFLYSPSILPYLTLLSKSTDDQTSIHRTPQILAGFMAGTATAFCMNPIDVVKTRMQTQNIQAIDKSTSIVVYNNVFHGLRNLVREEGIRGLSKGLIPKLISRGPLSAMSAVILELVLYYSRKNLV